jgi:hypothetical protein
VRQLYAAALLWSGIGSRDARRPRPAARDAPAGQDRLPRQERASERPTRGAPHRLCCPAQSVGAKVMTARLGAADAAAAFTPSRAFASRMVEHQPKQLRSFRA